MLHAAVQTPAGDNTDFLPSQKSTLRSLQTVTKSICEEKAALPLYLLPCEKVQCACLHLSSVQTNVLSQLTRSRSDQTYSIWHWSTDAGVHAFGLQQHIHRHMCVCVVNAAGMACCCC